MEVVYLEVDNDGLGVAIGELGLGDEAIALSADTALGSDYREEEFDTISTSFYL